MADRRAQLALEEAILRDIEQLKEKAQRHGVTAYLQRPVQRERPNERFLVNTIRSVQQANKRAEEEELWARRKQQVERETASGEPSRHRDRSPGRRKADEGRQERSSSRRSRQGRRPSQRQNRERGGATASRGDSRPLRSSSEEGSEGRIDRKRRRSRGRSGGSRSPSRSRSRSLSFTERRDDDCGPRGAAAGRADSAEGSPYADAAGPAAGEELDLGDVFRGKRVRGRGALGSRMDEAGPFMAPPDEDVELENEDTAVLRRRPVGPAKPAWLETEPPDSLEGAGGHALGREQTSIAGVAGGAAARPGEVGERRRSKKKRREKKDKKRRKKEKAHKQRKKRKSDSSPGGSSGSGSSNPD